MPEMLVILHKQIDYVWKKEKFFEGKTVWNVFGFYIEALKLKKICMGCLGGRNLSLKLIRKLEIPLL